MKGQIYLLFIHIDMELKVYVKKNTDYYYITCNRYTKIYVLSFRKTIQYNDIMTSMSLFIKRVENFGNNINLGELDNESVIHLKL